AILPLNLLVQLLLLPVYLFIFTGLSGGVQSSLILKSIMLTLVLPFGLSLLVRAVFAEKSLVRRSLAGFFSNHVFLFLWLAIMGMFASEARELKSNTAQFFRLLPPVLLFFFLNFFAGRLAGRLAKFSRADSVSLSLTTLARNSPVSLAVAVTAFPQEPLIALTLVIGPLIEIPVLTIIAKVLVWLPPGPETEPSAPAGRQEPDIEPSEPSEPSETPGPAGPAGRPGA
ncbi:MAG: hypothetical protein LBK52_02105, partial [Deltaproteobacteria bacterium]|nr:hypothetical protein [Deltaproteobacteria bacterium]